MANVNPTVNRAPQGAQSVVTASWTLGDADDGIAVTLTDYADRSIQVSGSFNGATATIEGSNDGTNWFTLRDPQGAALTFTAAGLKQVLETTLQIRPKSSGGAGASLTVVLVGHKVDPRAW